MNSMIPSALTGHSQLRRLVALRSVAIAAQLLTLAVVWKVLELQLVWTPMLLTIAALASINLFTWLHLRGSSPVSNPELFAQLCVDVIALSILLYYGGGSTNPFISLFLLPLVIAAATLPGRYTWGMAALTAACYSVLMVYYVPLPHNHQHDGDTAFNAHVLGMWLGFVISAVVVAYFVVQMAQAVRSRDEMLARVREEILRNERIVALGTQAAGAAHELGTPLSTMAVVIGELRHDVEACPDETADMTTDETTSHSAMPPKNGSQTAGYSHLTGEATSQSTKPPKNDGKVAGYEHSRRARPGWRDGLSILDEQVRGCKRILDKILANAQHNGAASLQAADRLVAEVLDEWQLLRPAAQYHYSSPAPSLTRECRGGVGMPEEVHSPLISVDATLRAALMNLLNNAADASPQAIEIRSQWDAENFTLEIHDHGEGLSKEAILKTGSAFFTTKTEGHGLGLFLANATIERMGGSVRLFNREGGGATTLLTLPIARSGA